MKRRTMLMLTMTVALALTLFSCGGAGGDGVLKVVNWAEYGTDDPAFVAAFEEAYGCRIVQINMSSEEDLLTRLRTAKRGEIDVCLPNCTILTAAIEEGLLKEIDVRKLSNFETMFNRFKTQKEVMMGGKHYAVPWVWGSTAIAYNTDEIGRPPASLSVLFDEEYAGRITFRDDYNDAVMAAAIVTGQDPNNPTDMNAIKDALLAQKRLNRNYWETGDEFSKMFSQGEIAVGMMWSGQAASMKLDGEPIAFVVPGDGAIGWVDTWGIAAGSQNVDLAYAFIDWMISDEFQLEWATGGGPAPVNQVAAGAIDSDYALSAGMDEVSLNRLFFMEYRTDDVKREWSELWTEVKATN